jgi:ankyrin repeat protein
MSALRRSKYQEREIVLRRVLEQAEKGKIWPFVDEILAGVLDYEQMDSKGFTALHLAVWLDDKDSFFKLLDKAACPIDLPSGNGQTALIIAANKGFLDIIKICLDRGADLEAKDQTGLTPLMTAASAGQVAAFFVLARRGGLADVVDKNGCTIVHWAAYKNQVHMLRAFRTLGISFKTIDFEGMNPLHRAALGNAIHCVEFLIEAGVDLMEKDLRGRDVAKVAADNKSEAALMTIGRVDKDSRDVMQFFTYLYILFWLSIYTAYHQYIFDSTLDNLLISVLFNFAYLWLFPLFM